MKMKAIILAALCLLTTTTVNAATIKRNVDLTKDKPSLTDFKRQVTILKSNPLTPAKLTKKKKQKLLGTWNFEINDILYQIDITSVNNSAFIYDVITNAGSAGVGLFGTIGKNEITFTVPFLNGYSQVVAFPNKKVTQWNLVEVFVLTQFCEFTGFIDSNTGLEVFECISPTAQIAEINEGVATR